jgi:ABC-type Fe2+-enterobactin transport system substrate-binding protein
MSHFSYLPEFVKELKKLIKKYRSLEQDLRELEQIITKVPTGVGKNFTIIHRHKQVEIVKTRLACASLKARSMRVIYAYHQDLSIFKYMELYFKGKKENEDRQRIKEYLKNF